MNEIIDVCFGFSGVKGGNFPRTGVVFLHPPTFCTCLFLGNERREAHTYNIIHTYERTPMANSKCFV